MFKKRDGSIVKNTSMMNKDRPVVGSDNSMTNSNQINMMDGSNQQDNRYSLNNANLRVTDELAIEEDGQYAYKSGGGRQSTGGHDTLSSDIW